MPAVSRKRYPPLPVDITNEIQQPMLDKLLDDFAAEWRRCPMEIRQARASQRLEDIPNLSSGPEQILKDDIGTWLPLPTIARYGARGAYFALDEQITFHFLHWFYSEIATNPDLPGLDEMRQRLIEAANTEINEAHQSKFRSLKQDELEIVAYALFRSLANRPPSTKPARDLMDDLGFDVEVIAGTGEYDPLSIAVVRRLLEIVSGYAVGEGIAFERVRELRDIFKPKELVILSAYVWHEREPEFWPWSEVLRHTELNRIMSESTIKKYAMTIRTKLEQNPDIEIVLLVD